MKKPLYDQYTDASERHNPARFQGRGYPGGVRIGASEYTRIQKLRRETARLERQARQFDAKQNKARKGSIELKPKKDKSAKAAKYVLKQMERKLKATTVPATRSLLPLAKMVPFTDHWLRRLTKYHPWFRAINLIEHYTQTPQLDGGYDMSGWNMVCTTGVPSGPFAFPTGAKYKVSSFNPGVSCGIQGQVPDGSQGSQIDFGYVGSTPNRFRWVGFGPGYLVGGTVGRMAIDTQWSRSGTGTPDPLRKPIPYIPGKVGSLIIAEEQPSLPDWLEPLRKPQLISPNPQAIPYAIVPMRPRQPPGMSEWGNTPYRPGQYIREKAKADEPYIPPTVTPRPPEKNTKEKKVVGPVVRAILRIWDTATETNDLLKCLLDSLPSYVVGRGYAKGGNAASIVWENWDKIDAAGALECAIVNHFTDKVAGATNRALKDKGLGVGFQGTPYVRQKRL